MQIKAKKIVKILDKLTIDSKILDPYPIFQVNLSPWLHMLKNIVNGIQTYYISCY